MKLQIKTKDCLLDAHKVRHEVFIEEQGFSMDQDKTDSTAIHVVIYDDGKPVATARTFPKEDEADCYTIGRVAVLKQYRGRGLGAMIMEKIEDEIRKRGISNAYLSSQDHAVEFYKSVGYTPYGDWYYDEHCLHMKMRKSLT